jgi:hypothetical protein
MDWFVIPNNGWIDTYPPADRGRDLRACVRQANTRPDFPVTSHLVLSGKEGQMADKRHCKNGPPDGGQRSLLFQSPYYGWANQHGLRDLFAADAEQAVLRAIATESANFVSLSIFVPLG